MNRIFSLLSAGIILLFSGCSFGENPLPDQKIQKILPPQENIQLSQGKTFFGFLGNSLATLSPANPEEVITVSVTPSYDPISSVSLALQYDPKIISVSSLTSAEGVSPVFLGEKGEGKIHFTGILVPPLLGEDIPLFSFRVSPKSSEEVAETKITFLPNELSALLPDSKNTETAVRTNLPEFSVLLSQ
ncbi:hypothetical protein IPN35_03605 [Candidatus Peregrinibacteria bacterium]|nr:MAG: hypothetical protein IPN35_03605 [Candidatus Peregrinibacteria bacterium]